MFTHEIFHRPDLDLKGSSTSRTAVRAVILKDGKLLMVYSTVTDEFKFPGGGVNEGESLEGALTREVSEETGGRVTAIREKIGTVTEYNRSAGDAAAFFTMFSHYFLVEIENELAGQNLDSYEKDLGFLPRWTSIEDAEKTNLANIQRNSGKSTAWIQRETYVLGELKKLFG